MVIGCEPTGLASRLIRRPAVPEVAARHTFHYYKPTARRMPDPLTNDLESLSADLKGLKGSLLVGVLVGEGSIILHFNSGSSILVQCAFETVVHDCEAAGHGEIAATAIHLFDFLNGKVIDATNDENALITLKFGAAKKLQIRPDKSGLESYVLRTPKGVLPIY
jgi:hypothetical protein